MTMPSLSTETMFMPHESGTKFYEITLLNAADMGRFLVVKRWGKMDARRGGGEVQVLTYPTPRAALVAAEKLKNDKLKRGYSLGTATHGYGANTSLTGTEAIVSTTKAHYIKHWPMVIQALGLEESGVTNVWVDETADVVVEEPAPEPKRGEHWGSW